MTVDERGWLGDPAAETRRKKAQGSAAASVAATEWARPFPAAAAKILALTSGDEFDVPAIVAALESDVGLATGVLRLVNSASFGLRTGCSSIKRAVPLLGAHGIRRATVAGSVLNLFPGDGSAVWRELHEHAALVGGLARHLAPEWRVPADEMFTAAFLHDIGKWLLLEMVPDYLEILGRARDRIDASLDEEHDRFGFDHAELGEAVLLSWQLPRGVAQIVGLHHDPASAYAGDSAVALRVALLRAADQLARCIANRRAPDFDALGSSEPFAYLGLSGDAVRERFDALALLFRDRASSGDASASGDSSPLHAIPTLARTNEACDFCDGAAFGGRCKRCGTRLCTAHMNTQSACPTCKSEASMHVSRERGPERTAVVFGLIAMAVMGCVAVAFLGHRTPLAAVPLVVAIVAIVSVALSACGASGQAR